MSITAMKQALEALEDACGGRCNAEYNPCWQQEAAQAIRTAIEQAEKQEPVAWRDGLPSPDELEALSDGNSGMLLDCEFVHKLDNLASWVRALYTTPPAAPVKDCLTTQTSAQRQWVGLTDEERTYLAWESNNGPDCVALTEAKLKEKNT